MVLSPISALFLLIAPPLPAGAQPTDPAATPIVARHLDASREEANKRPRSEGDQAVVEGWPLYRSARGQAAFNHAMATLAATDAAPPAAAAFRGCDRLECALKLPAMTADGWLAPGRLWVSPTEYVLIAHSPRHTSGKYRRHAFKRMKVFVYHEFINSSRNVDPYDTISSHDDDVFVPLYMSKTRADARGRRFVVVVQVAPYDVVSVHATNLDSAGPGLEVAKNAGEELEPLQALAGVLVGVMLKTAAPHLEVVNHRGAEGLAMLQAFEGRLERLARRSNAVPVTLPFTPAEPQRVAQARVPLHHVIARPGASPPIPVAQRGFAPVQSAAAAPAPVLLQLPVEVRRATRM